MLAAIQLDYQVGLHAREIHDVSTNGMLSSKTKAGQLSITQKSPEFAFGIGRLLAKMPGEAFETRAVIVSTEHLE
jgi:hypothetical protein